MFVAIVCGLIALGLAGLVGAMIYGIIISEDGYDESVIVVFWPLIFMIVLGSVALDDAYKSGQGQSASSESLTVGSVYEFVYQTSVSNGKYFLMLRLAEEGTSPCLYEYVNALPEGQKYFQAVRVGGGKKTLVPFPSK